MVSFVGSGLCSKMGYTVDRLQIRFKYQLQILGRVSWWEKVSSHMQQKQVPAIGHITYCSPPQLHKENISSLFCFTQPVEYCVVTENMHTSTTEGILLRPPTPLEITIYTFLYSFGLTPPLRKFQSFLWGGGGYGYLLGMHITLPLIRR